MARPYPATSMHWHAPTRSHITSRGPVLSRFPRGRAFPSRRFAPPTAEPRELTERSVKSRSELVGRALECGVLIQCPECSQEVSDRAAACPKCAFPVAEAVAEAKEKEATQRDRLSRETAGEVDCPRCKARGFVSEEQTSSFYWCPDCEHSGRVVLVQSQRGFWAVPFADVAGFVAGGEEQPTFLGTDRPTEHRYPKAGERRSEQNETDT